MTLFLTILAPILGILGVTIGVLLNEFMRRQNRREVYAPKVFERRLAVYEGLAELINSGSTLANQAMDDPDLKAEERRVLVSEAILPIAVYTDRYRLFIDEELRVHCTALFMGVEDIHDAPEGERAQLREDYRKMYIESYRMIAEDAGIEAINGLFKKINRPRIESPVIEYLRKLRRETVS